MIRPAAMAARAAAMFLRGYQLLISPIYGPVCRYAPSCSHYAHEAVLTHGVARGGWLALRRLARCHPWGGSGFDPVPARGAHRQGAHAHRHTTEAHQG